MTPSEYIEVKDYVCNILKKFINENKELFECERENNHCDGVLVTLSKFYFDINDHIQIMRRSIVYPIASCQDASERFRQFIDCFDKCTICVE